MKVCVICKEEYGEYGNSAAPVAKGRCCDHCNYTIVVPARLRDGGISKDEAENTGELIDRFMRMRLGDNNLKLTITKVEKIKEVKNNAKPIG